MKSLKLLNEIIKIQVERSLLISELFAFGLLQKARTLYGKRRLTKRLYHREKKNNKKTHTADINLA